MATCDSIVLSGICDTVYSDNAINSRWKVLIHTCLFSDTNCVSSCRMVNTPESREVDRAMMSPCSRCMPFGGLRRALSGWWRYWAPMLSFFIGPDRLGMAFSEPVLLVFCFTDFKISEQTMHSLKWALSKPVSNTIQTWIRTSFLLSISKSLSLPGSPSSSSSLLWRKKKREKWIDKTIIDKKKVKL